MGNCCACHVRSRKASRHQQQQLQGLHVPNLSPAGNPLPPIIHRVIRQHELAPGRLVVVGDVHGCLAELFQLLDAVKFDYGKDNLILTGDLCNKGPRSQEVAAAVRLLSEGQAWAVRGNNDDAALAAWWNLQQGITPLQAKLAWVGQLLPEDVDFLMGLPFSLTVEGYNLIVVHGGMLPGVPLEQQQLQHLAALRDVMPQPDGSFIGLERAEDGSQPWAGFWQGPQHVIFGHDSARRLQTCEHATGIDTGCCLGAQLTACVLPPLRELQQRANSAAVQQGVPVTLHDLGAVLVSVPSGSTYQGDDS
ncbi:Metallo-dependent phosphatase-like protein [Scenedesmus sp. NREL 46B-D3]|nr:Metallo-dependent phosphatase-like protein [Scenedesmus sp. NREL 46B-D3]